MKRTELENQLKTEAQEHVPDVYDRILESARGEGLIHAQSCPSFTDKTKNRRTGKRRAAAILSAVASLAVCAAIVVPVALYGGGTGGGVTSVSLSSRDVYGMGAVTTAKLLCGEMTGGALSSLSAVRLLSDKDTSSVKDQTKKFHEYFTMFESFLGDDLFTTVEEKNADGAYAQYEQKLTVTGVGLRGNTEQYVMYFNEILCKQDTDGDETEQEYVLDGVLSLDGADYMLCGERSFSTEKGETENELWIRAYPEPDDGKTYVEMEQEDSVEKGETKREYVYKIVKNGKLIEETSVEFEAEQKGGKEKIKYEIEFRSGEGKGKYELERETKNGVHSIKAKYDLDGESGEFYIRPEAGGYLYVFPDGSTVTFENNYISKIIEINFQAL